jgi:hypothetical protein
VTRASRWSWFALLLHTTAFGFEGSIDATIPVEVLEPDPQFGRGAVAIGSNIWRAPVPLALQPARIARGIVIERSAGRTEVLALAVLAPFRKTGAGALDLDPPREAQAWCELASTGFVNTMSQFAVDCYQDLDGDGALETEYVGRLSGTVGVMVSSIDTPKKRSPLTYRVAKPEELPKFLVGYRSCGRAAEKSAAEVTELRYATYIRREDGAKPGGAGCTEVAKVIGEADGGKRYRVGRFVLSVRETEGVLETTLIEGIPAGTLLANLAFDRPLLDATDPVPRVGMGEKPSLYLVTPPKTASSVKSGEIFLSAQVAHGITGTLRSDVKVRGWGRRIAFAAGTPAFGVPMSGTTTVGYFQPPSVETMTWCVPSRDESKALLTFCFTGPGSNAVLRSHAPFLVTYLSGTPRYSEPLRVDRGPVEFEAPLILSVRFVRAKDEYLDLESSVSYETEPVWTALRVQRRENGNAFVLVGGVVLRLTPDADGKKASVDVLGGTFKPGMDAVPRDVRVTSRAQ